MSAGLKVYKEDGSLLFDTEKITYGLLKSGYLSYMLNWPRLEYRSANLPPNEGSSYAESSFSDAIHGFSVTGAVAPIVFISGTGISCGSSKSGDTTTFYFIGASPNTKFYYFDTMRNTMNGAGLKCYDEAGTLTFNSLQYPLNIVDTISAPAPPTPTVVGGIAQYTVPFAGATKQAVRFINSGVYYCVARIFIAVGSGEYAASTTFSRSLGQGIMDGMSAPGTPFPAYGNQQAHMDGAYGATGGIYFMACDAARTTMIYSTAAPNRYFDIPTNRYPQALVIKTDNLPFPFN
ncbi:hypothetical protein HU763_006915 [Pseudomonas anuradhapurensis]|uniref:hypothetical protein n=1 Tax=Pseudomonas anuradhapurensis TaxID=485870 RepID=UPI0016460802|nr:hypothetical protein [Pseudomonas anuradhapurensis]QXI49172.1 hypothetical protein HU763_006915 [Pseudomonas anuradhapurensis]